jgi:hypothetical protein
VTVGKIDNMDVVANASAINGIVVVTEYAKLL